MEFREQILESAKHHATEFGCDCEEQQINAETCHDDKNKKVIDYCWGCFCQAVINLLEKEDEKRL